MHILGHAYLTVEGRDGAEVLGAMSSAEDKLMHSLLSIHEMQRSAQRSILRVTSRAGYAFFIRRTA